MPKFNKNINRIITAAKNANQNAILTFVEDLKNAVTLDSNRSKRLGTVSDTMVTDIVNNLLSYKIPRKYRRLISRLIWQADDVIFDSVH